MSRQEVMSDVLVGRTSDGARIYVTAAIYQRTGAHETVTHEMIENPRALALSGLVVDKGQRNASAAGQCLDALDDITRPEQPFTMADVRTLAQLWRRWHLNDMKAGCAHVPEPLWENDPRYGYRRPDLEHTPACPETGYRYGHAWLVEPLPDDGTGTVDGSPESVLRFIASKSPTRTYAGV